MTKEDDKAAAGVDHFEGDTEAQSPAADSLHDEGPSEEEEVEALEEAPQVDFATFILSLATNALMSLDVEGFGDRVPGAKVDLKAAAQHIDVLVMLEEKTRNNLSKQETDLLQSVLYDLRMRYVEATARK